MIKLTIFYLFLGPILLSNMNCLDKMDTMDVVVSLNESKPLT